MSEAIRSMDEVESSEVRHTGSTEALNPTEQAAIRICQSGDISGLETLYEMYSEKVFRTCFRILGDQAAAEDQTHEVFLRVFEKIGRFRGRARFSTWLYRLSVNLTLNRLRGRKRRLLRMLGIDFLEGKPAAGPAPDHLVLLKEQADTVHEMLSSLSVEHRAVLVLREIEELSYMEISEILDIPQGTVMSRLHRARHELKSNFSSRNSEDQTSVQIERGDETGE